MLKSVELKDYMMSNPITVRADDSMNTAIKLILEHKISGVCVTDENDHLVGILSEMDCLRAILSATYNKTSIGFVHEFMADDKLVVAHPQEAIIDVAQDMLSKNKRRRPVMKDGKLVGQITCRQLLSAVMGFSS